MPKLVSVSHIWLVTLVKPELILSCYIFVLVKNFLKSIPKPYSLKILSKSS